ncbi:ATP-binding protein [Krasilnikovia sp. MM14-A1259]|uniref:sensor histidine kinase n=1 Tax=Krasilnikovia sp. MM14-A1259 TaxID=3373539 RepID=UPI0037F60397
MNIGCGNAALHDSQAVLTVAPDAYVAIDASGQVIGWNPAAEATFGYSREYACERSVEEMIIPERYRAAHRAGLTRLAAGGAGRVLGQRMQLSAVHRDGHEFPIEMTLTATDGAGGRVFHCLAHDVTAARRADLFLAADSAVHRGLAQANSSTDAAARVVEALGLVMEWPVVELWLIDERRQLLCCEARHVDHAYSVGQFGIDELELGEGLPGRVLMHNRVHWIPDLATEGSLRSIAAARAGLHLAAGVPVCAYDQTLGALCVFGNRVEETDEAVLALLAGMAAQLGQYLDRRHAEELEVELARTKDEFLALVTHELRNPLSVITATASVAETELRASVEDEQRGYLRTILRSAQRLSVLADDLLDLARLESGHLGMHPVATDLTEIIGGSVEAHAAPVADKDLTVTVRVPRELPLHADPHRLRQVADNLLSNAIKYTPAGGAVIVTADTDSSGEQIVWTVSDTGIGIPPADRPRLFRRFYRASTALERRIPGTGLGLAITRTIVERHHGTIDLADGHATGTTFVVRLPTKPPQPAST